MTETTVVTVRSGFPWDDEGWRWLAFSGSLYAYGRLPEDAASDLREMMVAQGLLPAS